MTKTFNWLHLSDLHIGQKGDYLWPNFREQFYKDLEYLLGEAGQLQLVVFSGDLTQRALAEEFDDLTTELKRLWDFLGKHGSAPQLIAVPGNHDLSRPHLKSDPSSGHAAVKMLNQWHTDPDVMNELFSEDGNNQYLEVIRKLFSNYTNWYSQVDVPKVIGKSGLIPGDFAGVVDSNGLKVGVVGLNSAFTQIAAGNYEGKLFVSPKQLSAVTNGEMGEWCNSNDFNLLITHHPPEWYESQALVAFNREINKPGRFLAHLYGHMHLAEAKSISTNGAREKRVIQASSLFGMESWGEHSTHKRSHGYSLHKFVASSASASLISWPRIHKASRESDRIIPNHDFEIPNGQDYIETSIGEWEQVVAEEEDSAQSAVVLKSDRTTKSGEQSLSGAAYKLSQYEHHLNIRGAEQIGCSDAIEKDGIAWICSDWGSGRDGFIWSVLHKIKFQSKGIYRIDLANFTTIKEFLDKFVVEQSCSFPEFCAALSSKGKSILIFDDSPTNSSSEVFNLAEIAKGYLDETLIFICSNGVPKEGNHQYVRLMPLEEPDTRLYLEAKKNDIHESLTPAFVYQVHRKSEGIISRIDLIIKKLEFESINEIAPPELALEDVDDGNVPASLIATIKELKESRQPLFERAFLLLKILAMLPNGESLQTLKHIHPQQPLFSDHSVTLSDRDLIISRSSGVLIGADDSETTLTKLMVVPTQVRSYVLSKMDDKEIKEILRLIADLYFGKTWSTGNHKKAKLIQIIKQDTEGAAGNAHSILLRMLKESFSGGKAQSTSSAVLKICIAYCSALQSAANYRRAELVAMEVLALIPKTRFVERNAIEKVLAKAYRMTREQRKAIDLYEALIENEKSNESKASMYLNLSLCYMELKDERAPEMAKKVIALSPKSAAAIQAQSIILQLQNKEENGPKLLALEKRSRKAGYTTVANNLTIKRVTSKLSPSSIDDLRVVMNSTEKDADNYNKYRAMGILAKLLIERDGNLLREDLKNLIDSYYYFYGERFDVLFKNAHQVLWEYYESKNNLDYMLILFRLSSFVWRLKGEFGNEQMYLRNLESKRAMMAQTISPLDKNYQYFNSRSEITSV